MSKWLVSMVFVVVATFSIALPAFAVDDDLSDTPAPISSNQPWYWSARDIQDVIDNTGHLATNFANWTSSWNNIVSTISSNISSIQSFLVTYLSNLASINNGINSLLSSVGVTTSSFSYVSPSGVVTVPTHTGLVDLFRLQLSSVSGWLSLFVNHYSNDTLVKGGFIGSSFLPYERPSNSFASFNTTYHGFVLNHPPQYGDSYSFGIYFTSGGGIGAQTAFLPVPLSGTISMSYGNVFIGSQHLDQGDYLRFVVPDKSYNFDPYYPFATFYWVVDSSSTSVVDSLNDSFGSQINDTADEITSADTAISAHESQAFNQINTATAQLDFSDSTFLNYAAGLGFVSDTFMLIWSNSPVLSGIITVSLMIGAILLILGRGGRLFRKGGGS